MASVFSNNFFRNINLYIDGISYAGQLVAFTPPSLKLKDSYYQAAGMDAPIAIDRGMEAINASFSLSSYDAEAIMTWGVAGAGQMEFVCKGALETMSGEVKSVVLTMRGRVLELRRNNFDPRATQDQPNITVDLNCYYYKEEIDGYVAIEIDVINFIRIINGVDHLAKIREALGLGLVSTATGQINRARRAISAVESVSETVRDIFN